jgi:DNA-binding NtrC family response regulator
MCNRQVCLEGMLAQTASELKSAETRLRKRKHELVRAGALDEADPSGLVVRSSAMARVIDMAKRVARVDSSILVTGESGVGKERIARIIHDESTRAGRSFVAVNCSAVSESLLESELFGHAKGAFTGATQDRPGLFEAANGGTLFLDEVGEIPLPMQAKLLRALQEREVRRVGENKNRSIDVRVVAATNRDLADEVAAGRFRKDLYYRLRVVEIRVPPLRERREDILPLARVLLADAARRMNRTPCTLSPEAANQLVHHDWPGNVRDLARAFESSSTMRTRMSRVAEGVGLDRREQLAGRHRFPQPEHGAAAPLGGHLGRRHEADGDLEGVRMGGERVVKLRSRHGRHQPVHEDQARARAGDEVDRLATRRGLDDPVSKLLQDRPRVDAVVGVVIDDEDRRHARMSDSGPHAETHVSLSGEAITVPRDERRENRRLAHARIGVLCPRVTPEPTARAWPARAGGTRRSW